MITITYHFDNVSYTLAEMPDNGADLTIRWTPKIWGTLHYKADGSSTVTTPAIPRFFNALTINWMQKRYRAVILTGKGKSAFKKLQAHFDARKLQSEIRNT